MEFEDGREPSQGDHVVEGSTPTDTEALKISALLLAKYYDGAALTWWWNCPNDLLDGSSPHKVWLGAAELNPATIATVTTAANTAPKMGHAT